MSIVTNPQATTEFRVPRRVLVIDDEQRMANSIRTLLTNFGYDVEVAYSGHEGLDKLHHADFQLVITDLRMAEGDGNEVMRVLGKRPDIRFIVITGYASTESAIEAVHNNAFDYIAKPFDFEVLRAAVDRAFERIEAERFRDDMISMITHDIKIPLSSIIGYSTLIFDKDTNQPSPRAHEFVQTIHANGMKILSLIDNFLTTCKIDSGKLTVYPRNVNLNYILEDLMSVFHAAVEKNHLTMTLDLAPDLPSVQGDENLLFRAIGNAISNAVKFTPEGGRIQVSTRVCETDQSPLSVPTLRIEVSNTGEGIPEEDLAQIFDKFRRSRSGRGIEGSGIGTYVLRSVVEAHGGIVTVQSEPNVLTTFTIFLPFSTGDVAKDPVIH